MLSFQSIAFVSSNDLIDIKSPGMSSIFVYLILFAIVILLAYYSTRFLSKSYVDLNSKSNIKIIEKKILSGDKQLFIVEVDNIFYILSVDKNTVNLIDKREQINLLSNDVKNEMNFKDILKKIDLKGKKNEED